MVLSAAIAAKNHALLRQNQRQHLVLQQIQGPLGKPRILILGLGLNKFKWTYSVQPMCQSFTAALLWKWSHVMTSVPERCPWAPGRELKYLISVYTCFYMCLSEFFLFVLNSYYNSLQCIMNSPPKCYWAKIINYTSTAKNNVKLRICHSWHFLSSIN